MPIYVFFCNIHGDHETFRHMRDSDKPAECPTCGETMAKVVTAPRVAVAAEKRSDDDLTRQHYGLKPGEQAHTNYLTGETLKFEKGTPKRKAQEAIRQSYIKAGLTQAEDAGAVKVRN